MVWVSTAGEYCGFQAARLAQEKVRQEAEQRQRRELEERRKTLAKKRAEVEEKNRWLEVCLYELVPWTACAPRIPFEAVPRPTVDISPKSKTNGASR